MQVRFFDIKWELDGQTPEDAGVPTEVVLEVDDELNVDKDGADVLSDRFGWLVMGFDFEIKGKTFGIFDWAGNRPFGEQTYPSFEAAWDVVYAHANKELGEECSAEDWEDFVGEYEVEALPSP